MIRSSLLAFASIGFLWVASPANAQPVAASVQPLLHFDTPGHQSADVTQVIYHRHRRHHYYRHHH